MLARVRSNVYEGMGFDSGGHYDVVSQGMVGLVEGIYDFTPHPDAKGWYKYRSYNWHESWLLWADINPTKEIVFEIITKETRQKAKSQLIKYSNCWWMRQKDLLATLKGAYAMLSCKQFEKLVKLYPDELLEAGPLKYLPVVMNHPKLASHSYQKLIAERLREA